MNSNPSSFFQHSFGGFTKDLMRITNVDEEYFEID